MDEMASCSDSAGLPVEERLSYLAVKLGEMVIRQADAVLAPLGLKPREYNVMTCIACGDDVSQQDLVRMLGIYAPGLVGLLDILQGKALVDRRRSTTDRRRHILSLTNAGRALLARADVVTAGLEDDLFGGMTEPEKLALRALIKRVELRPKP
jgi:DNA-binding MarR family transcriptional regulator